MENQLQPQSKRKRWIWTLVIILAIGFFSLFFIKTGFTINQVINWVDDTQDSSLTEQLPKLPEKDPNRINILLLGIRGPDDPGEGKFLSDAMILLSIQKNSGQVALISFPRDIYTRIWCEPEKKKINFAYAYGGLDCAKKTISLISGLYVNYAVSVDFEALKEGVDALGGIDIYLEEPFEEDFQWAKEGKEENENWFIKEFDEEERWVFRIPEGENHLDGQTILYYARSRYSTDDFDRMRRQQQVLMAIKEKTFSLGVLANPVKIYNLLDVLGRHLRTDMSLADIKNLIKLAADLDKKNIKRKVFDNGPNGLLYHTFINDEYVLLPIGDNFDQIEEASKNIFN